MVRLVFSMFMWVTVARWLYAEAQLTVPGVVPAIDGLLEVVQIPTHDQWSKESIEWLVVQGEQLVSATVALADDKSKREWHEPVGDREPRFEEF